MLCKKRDCFNFIARWRLEQNPVTEGSLGAPIIGARIEEQAVSRPKLVASLWHTWAFLFLYLVPLSYWLPLKKIFPDLEHYNLSLHYTLQFGFQWIFFLVLLLGLRTRETRVRELIGVGWHSWKDFSRDMKLGIALVAWNFLVVIIVVIILVVVLRLGHSTPDHLAPHTWIDLLGWIPIACTAGFTEEIIFRGYLYRQFHALTGSPRVALIAQAALFSLAHGFDQSMASLVAKFIMGLSFGFLAISRKSLLPGILGHACQDGLWGILSVA
jgi:membrane protease YdiL (CAAX protease family)